MKGPPSDGNALLIPAPLQVAVGTKGPPSDGNALLIPLLCRWLWRRILREISVGIRDSLAKVLDDPCGALPDLADGGSPRLANLYDGRAGARDDVIDHVGGAGAEFDHRLADRLGQLSYERGVVVDRRENPVNDPGDVVEARLEQYFRLDTLDSQLHTAERGVDAHVQIQEVEDIRLQRHPRRQVLHLERDLVDA